MTQEDIIRMGKEADLITWGFQSNEYEVVPSIKAVEHFAALVAAAEQKKWEDQTAIEIHEAILDEREACAKLCETLGVHPAVNVWNGGPDWYKHGKNCAAEIRARGKA